MRKITAIGFIFALCLSVTACDYYFNIPIDSEALINISQVASALPSSPAPSTPLMEETEDVQLRNYSDYVGVWRGYAIVTTYTLVITDVVDDEMTFLFVNLNKFCPVGDTPDGASAVYTMPIIDNQIVFVDERIRYCGEQFTQTQTLTFYDNHISLFISNTDYDGYEFGFEWRLTRLP